MRALNRKLFRDLFRIRGQVIAIAAVMAAGVAAAVMSWGALRSLDETRAAYYERYRFAHVFALAKRVPLPLTEEIAAIPGVRSAEPRLSERALLDMPGLAEPARGHVLSLPDGRAPRLNALKLRAGRWLEPGRRDEVLVHELFAEAHGLAPGDTLRMTLGGKRREFHIAGIALSPEFIYVLGPGDLVPDNRRYGVLWMPRDTLEAAFDLEGAFDDLTIELAPGAMEAEVIRAVDRFLDPYGGTGAYGRDDQVSHAFLDSELQQLRAMTTIFPPIFLAVAAFLVNVVMGRIIASEREEIGVLKAFGYTDLAIAIHYLRFVLLISAIGILTGWAGGIWLGRGMTALYTEYFRFPFLYYVLSPDVFAITALVSLGAALGGAAIQVRKAAALAPAVAMRPPPPTSYRQTLLERLGTVGRMGPLSVMILRHITRWPVRSGITCLGVALSVALLVMSLFFLDAINAMVERYFFQTLRNDVRVSFAQTEADAAVSEISGLPGVRAAEPFRSVPVRLRNGHRSERLGLLALERNGKLFQHLDAQGRVVELPERGIMLNLKLAQSLGVKAGDRIRLEALEAARPIHWVRVATVVEEFVGKSAYMARPELNRLMGEGAVVSGADLLIDPMHQDRLFAELKRRPDVEALTVRSAAVAEFERLLDSNIKVTLTFYILFGSVIALGVVYNAARISLAERSRELASMRVLGFRKSETAYVLVGELAVLVLLALPLGCFLGAGLAAIAVAAFETDLYRIPYVIERSTYGTAVLIVLTAATVSGAAVVYRVTHLDLIGVLKTRE